MFIFRGFKDSEHVRQFTFDCVADDRSRTPMAVTADMSLARKYQILLQDLPRICMRLLEALPQDKLNGSVNLSEENMIAIQTANRDAAEKKRTRAPKPSAATGHAWRAPRL